jgi:hypothetical protein
MPQETEIQKNGSRFMAHPFSLVLNLYEVLELFWK